MHPLGTSVALQEQRRKLAEDQEREAEQQQQQEQQEAAAKAKAWTFEEESDEDEEDAAMPDATGQAPAAEGGDTAVQDAVALSRPPPLTGGMTGWDLAGVCTGCNEAAS